MRYAPVLPAAAYPLLDWGTYHLIQAHTIPDGGAAMDQWLQDRRYPSVTHHVIFDNGLIELGEPDVDSLLRMAEQYRPHEVICPDVAFEAQQTIDNFRRYGKECQQFVGSVMVVPQGRSLTEWCDCAEQLARIAAELKVSIVYGVTKLLNDLRLPILDLHTPREYALTWLSQFMHANGFWHQVHLLGIHDKMIEASHEVQRAVVRGMDSTQPYATALHQDLLSGASSKVELDRVEWQWQANAKVLRLAEINIAMARRLLGETS